MQQTTLVFVLLHKLPPTVFLKFKLHVLCYACFSNLLAWTGYRNVFTSLKRILKYLVLITDRQTTLVIAYNLHFHNFTHCIGLLCDLLIAITDRCCVSPFWICCCRRFDQIPQNTITAVKIWCNMFHVTSKWPKSCGQTSHVFHKFSIYFQVLVQMQIEIIP